jgi:uncharacterized RDD family membrane protein YckC
MWQERTTGGQGTAGYDQGATPWDQDGRVGRWAVPGPRAGFWIRVLAFLIDQVALFIVALFLQASLGYTSAELVLIVVDAAYFTLGLGGPSGQTLGAKVAGIRVVDARTGGPIGYGRGLVRWVVQAFLGWLIIPYLWMLWDRERQTWQDKVAGDVVVPAWWRPGDGQGW